MRGFDFMKKRIKLKKWARVTIAIILFIIAGYLLAHFILGSMHEFDDISKKCDKDKGYTCSYYEVRQYIIYGDSNE